MRAAAAAAAAALLLFLLTTVQLAACTFWQYSFHEDFEPIPPCPPSYRTASGSELLLRTDAGKGCVKYSKNSSVFAAGYKRSASPIVFIHDRDSNARVDWIQSAQEKLAEWKSREYNGFAFNWAVKFSNDKKFQTKLSTAAMDLQNFLTWLALSGLQFNVSRLHLIGLGYGAIVAGIAARNLGKTDVGRVGRITALDPPVVKSGLQILPADADFVDVVRTTGGESTGKSMIGHVEFILDGAQDHPGIKSGYAINHEYAAFLFVNSLSHQNEYLSKRCTTFEEFKTGGCGVCANDCILMGFDIREPNENPTSRLPSLIPKNFRGRYHALTSVNARFRTTHMILVNVTVFATKTGTYRPILYVFHRAWQLTENRVEFNKTFAQVIVIHDDPHDATFTMEISVVRLPTLLTPKLLKIAVDISSMEPGGRKRTYCMREPEANDEFYLFNNC